MSNPDKAPSNIRLTVSMPYWRSSHLVRRAVDSILNQTYRNLRLIVVNDGDGEAVWEPLEDIEDPRLVRFDLPKNRGRYYADAVTLRATGTKWWTPHDSDDESLLDRYHRLISAIGEREAVFTPVEVHTRDNRVVRNEVRPDRLVPPAIGTIAKYPAGLYRTDAARMIGGPHPEMRGSYDTTFVSLMWYAFKPLPVVDETMYIVYKRNGSLTTSKETHLKGEWRKQQRKRRKALYRQAIAKPLRQWAETLKASPQIEAQLKSDAERLRSELDEREGQG